MRPYSDHCVSDGRHPLAFGVFLYRSDSVYHDIPSERYQFPASYLSRATPLAGGWIVYLEPTKVRRSRGYFAVAQVQAIVPDPNASGMHVAVIQPGSYIDFADPVPFNGPDGLLERGLLNQAGTLSGRAQAAVRPLAADDFTRIIERGLHVSEPVPPREGVHAPLTGVADAQMPLAPRDRMLGITSRLIRDRVFRQAVLRAYDARCAITGLRIINGGGRAEVEAAHIRPVAQWGPDSVNNGLALSGTVHWMFDRGLIGISPGLEILISRKVNDLRSVRGLINGTGRLITPRSPRDAPHADYLAWHRENCFQ